jgi:protein TonB
MIPTGPAERPRRKKRVDPVYPERARKEQRSGMIVMETEIAPEGCIRSLEVVAGEHADLAVQAIVAVAQWRYTPSLVEGQRVPTMMTTSVTFQLR